ncbi:MAG TPA: hypothetical protein PKB06_02685 [Actinotalea sp.]|nr:hypothetical protein [Actinotalea sp.]
MSDPIAADAIASAPLPTAKTLARRQNVFFQLIRFAALNIKMIMVVLKGHG